MVSTQHQFGAWSQFDKMKNGRSDVNSDQSTEIIEVEGGRTDLSGLLEYLDQLQRSRAYVQEATYLGNKWFWQGMIPFEHYGFVLSLSNGNYLSLDFTRQGLIWDTYDEYPDHPDNTFIVEKYSIHHRSPFQGLQQYCKDTTPFILFINDCHVWCKGLMQHLQMEKTMETRKSIAPRTATRKSLCV